MCYVLGLEQHEVVSVEDAISSMAVKGVLIYKTLLQVENPQLTPGKDLQLTS